MEISTTPSSLSPSLGADVQTFVTQLSALLSGTLLYQHVSLDDVLAPWQRFERAFRNLCIQVSSINATLTLSNPYYGLIPIFDAPPSFRITPPIVLHNPKHHPVVMPLGEFDRRKPGDPCTVVDLADFRINWDIFTNGCFSALTDWSNMVVAGGAVEACLAAPVPRVTGSLQMRQDWFSKLHEHSDIDIFMYGLNEEEMEARIMSIVSAIRTATSQEPELERTRHTYSILLEEPYRKIQFVMRKFMSPADILIDFDVDAPCCLYDGDKVWASPRSIIAMMRQANTVDYARRDSDIYELRLAKYHLRNYELYFPALDRDRVRASVPFIGRNKDLVYGVKGVALLLTMERQFEEVEWLSLKKEILKRYCTAAGGDDQYIHFVIVGHVHDGDEN